MKKITQPLIQPEKNKNIFFWNTLECHEMAGNSKKNHKTSHLTNRHKTRKETHQERLLPLCRRKIYTYLYSIYDDLISTFLEGCIFSNLMEMLIQKLFLAKGGRFTMENAWTGGIDTQKYRFGEYYWVDLLNVTFKQKKLKGGT